MHIFCISLVSRPGIVYNFVRVLSGVISCGSLPARASFVLGIYSLALKYLPLFCTLYLVLANASAICRQVGCVFFFLALKAEGWTSGLWLCSSMAVLQGPSQLIPPRSTSKDSPLQGEEGDGTPYCPHPFSHQIPWVVVVQDGPACAQGATQPQGTKILCWG